MTDDAPQELIKTIVVAIGKIEASDSGVIGYPERLSHKMAPRLLEKIAMTAARAALEWLEFKR